MAGKILVLIVIVLSCSLARQQPPQRVSNGEVPVVSPDGSHIAFASNRNGSYDLYVISADGSGELQLTHARKYDNPIGWSADSKQIIFSYGAGDTGHTTIIGIIDIDGKNQHVIGQLPGGSVALSPDRKRVTYMSGTWTSMKLMLASLDGSDAKPITDGSSVAWNSSWSPDGKHIAITTRKDPKGPLRVYIMNTDGSARHDATDIPVTEGQVQWPRWSRDGRYIATQVSDLTAHSSHIWTVDVATGKGTKLAPHDRPYNDETPSWFPDGKSLAFQSDRTGKIEIWVMDADGSHQRQVTGSRK